MRPAFLGGWHVSSILFVAKMPSGKSYRAGITKDALTNLYGVKQRTLDYAGWSIGYLSGQHVNEFFFYDPNDVSHVESGTCEKLE